MHNIDLQLKEAILQNVLKKDKSNMWFKKAYFKDNSSKLSLSHFIKLWQLQEFLIITFYTLWKIL